jgi:hypothetical protein
MSVQGMPALRLSGCSMWSVNVNPHHQRSILDPCRIRTATTSRQRPFPPRDLGRRKPMIFPIHVE